MFRFFYLELTSNVQRQCSYKATMDCFFFYPQDYSAGFLLNLLLTTNKKKTQHNSIKKLLNRSTNRE